MECVLQPSKHIVISTVIGAIGWWGTGDPAAGVAALAAGVLPDIDHLVDYAWYYARREHRLILPLHGYEFALLGLGVALSTGSILLALAAFSYLVHLLSDQAENRTRWLGYSLIFRAWHRFRLETLSTVPEDAARGRMNDLRGLTGLLSRWQRGRQRV